MTPAEKRDQITSILKTALAPLPVYAAVPSNVSPPCGVITMGATVKQPKRLSWEVEYHVTLIAPGGDNEAATQWLETMTLAAASALSEDLITQVGWDRPGTVSIAGTTHPENTLTFTVDIQPNPVPVGGK